MGAERSRVLLFLPGGRERWVTWPEGAAEGPFDRAVPVVHRGEAVGEIAVAKGAGEALTTVEEKLLADLASQAGLALRNAQLTQELHARLEEISATAEELRASRQRIVAAQDAERRRLERNIHDGAQQHLVALAVKLRLAQGLAERDPGRARDVLAELQSETTEALEALRDLARGIYPPLLADRGLPAAVEAHLRRSPQPVHLEVDPTVASARFDARVEAAAYFCCLEALQNAAKHAQGAPVTVCLTAEDGWLRFSVADVGPGFDPEAGPKGSGLQSMMDRVEALGGTLEIRSAPGRGTTVTGRIPAQPGVAWAQTSASRSGPKADFAM